MSFFDLFSSKTIDSIGDAIDKNITSDEERERLKIDYILATAAPNVARRILMAVIAFQWFIYCNIFIGAIFLESDKLETLASFGTTVIMPPMVAGVGFYFLKRMKNYGKIK